MIDREWLDASSDAEEAATLTARLVAHRSYPGEEAAVQGAVAAWFEEHGLRPQIQAVDGDWSNVLLRIENGPGPTLLLNGHVDTVVAVDGWSSNPWRVRRDGDSLYGLGACDMKAGVAAAMLVVRALVRRPDLWRGTLLFAAVVDEEAYSAGARALIDAGFAADFCLVTESSWARPCLGSVGKVLVRADVTGRAAHASWPAAGINAAVEAARFAARLDDLSLGSHPRLAATRCVLSIHGGNEQYVITVPEHASVLVNRMIVPGETRETVLAEMRALADDLRSPARFDLAVEPPYYPPWETPADHPLARAFAAAYAVEAGHPPEWGYTGFGDANLFAGERGIPTVQFGPDGGAFHQADEWVDVPSIGATVRVLLRLTMDLLAPRDAG